MKQNSTCRVGLKAVIKSQLNTGRVVSRAREARIIDPYMTSQQRLKMPSSLSSSWRILADVFAAKTASAPCSATSPLRGVCEATDGVPVAKDRTNWDAAVRYISIMAPRYRRCTWSIDRLVATARPPWLVASMRIASGRSQYHVCRSFVMEVMVCAVSPLKLKCIRRISALMRHILAITIRTTAGLLVSLGSSHFPFHLGSTYSLRCHLSPRLSSRTTVLDS